MRLFISHAGASNAAAIAIHDWLAENGWDDVFLDVHPERGIAPSQRWEQELVAAAKRCEAVMFLVCRAWLASKWCLHEFNLARRLNKRMFGVLIEELPLDDLPPDMKKNWQVVNLTSGNDHEVFRAILPDGRERNLTFSTSGLIRLRVGLAKAGLDPRFFAWPPEGEPERPPFRGLKPLEWQDAGIFFGREAQIVEGLDRLRGLADMPLPRLFVLLGASGAGKSSYLRAGLWPRLKRDDRNFLPLPVIRPERAAINGDAGLISALEGAFKAAGLARARAEIRAAIETGPEQLKALLAELAAKAAAPALDDEAEPRLPVIVISIDQGEELFLGDGQAEGARLLALLRPLLAEDVPRITLLIAMRSDSYERLQTAPALEGVHQHMMSLPPLARGAYADVVEGSSRRLADTPRKLKIEPALTAELLKDIEEGAAKDALPLLAFTLERLYLEHGGAGELTVAAYNSMGRVKGSIEAAVVSALKDADDDPAIPRDQTERETLLRRGLIPWLAGVDPKTGEPRRRVARMAEIPADARPLIRRLVEARLLSTDRVEVTEEATAERHHVETVEPAHEALLRQWGLLEGWLAKDGAALTTLDGVKRAASEWTTKGKSPAWFAHRGGRLEDAETEAARPEFSGWLDAEELNYLAACHAGELAELRLKHLTDHIITYGALVFAAVLAVVALVAVQLFNEASRQSLLLSNANDRISMQFSQRAIENNDPVTGMLLALEPLSALQNRAGDNETRAQLRDNLYTGSFAAQHEILILSGHTGAVRTAEFSLDSTFVVTASEDHSARVWNVDSGKAVSVLSGHGDIVTAAIFAQDGRRVFTASDDGTVRIWDTETGRQIRSLTGHENQVTGIALSPEGRHIVSASSDKTARVWDVNTGTMLVELKGHRGELVTAVYSPDGTRILTTSWDRTARLWDAEKGKELAVLRGHEAEVVSGTFSPDGKRIVTAAWDRTARLWDGTTGAALGIILRGHTGPVESAVFSPAGDRIVTASLDSTLRFWEANSGEELATVKGHTDWIHSVSFSPNGRRLVTASKDKTARIWVADVTAQLSVFRGHEAGLWSAALSPDNKQIITASDDGTARIWDMNTQSERQVLRGHRDGLYSASFSPDGTQVVTASKDGTARVWDLKLGTDIVVLPHQGEVWSASFSPDGKQIVTATDDPVAHIWNAESGQPASSCEGHEKRLTGAKFSPDGTRIATASYDTTARLWDVKTCSAILVLRGHEKEVQSVDFSPDGKYLVTSSWDNTARLWDVDTGEQLKIFKGHDRGLNSAIFSPDSKRIITSSFDWSAREWDITTGKEIIRFKWHRREVTNASYSQDGTLIVTSSADKLARIWQANHSLERKINEIQRSVPRCLSADERKQLTSLDPPDWCIELEKWPYNTDNWKQWLAQRKAETNSFWTRLR